jgi:hypothetical protein
MWNEANGWNWMAGRRAENDFIDSSYGEIAETSTGYHPGTRKGATFVMTNKAQLFIYWGLADNTAADIWKVSVAWCDYNATTHGCLIEDICWPPGTLLASCTPCCFFL